MKKQDYTTLHDALKGVDSLMSMNTYEKLFSFAYEKKPSLILEIGTAHGASAIAMSLGSSKVDCDCKTFTVDTLEALPGIPSSRSKFGGKENNREIVLRNFQRAGVEKKVHLFVGTSEEFSEEDIISQSIDILVLDADGRIDRDLLLFSKRFTDNTSIIIDDTDGRINVGKTTSGPFLDLKHVISKRILDRLVSHDMIIVDEVVGNTSFCRVKNIGLWSESTLIDIALSSYRDLIFVPLDKERVFFTLAKWFVKISPFNSSATRLYMFVKKRVLGRN